MSKPLPVTPVQKLPIVAKVRSTRKGKLLAMPLGGSMGGKGVEGTHYYEITVVGGVNVPERLQCSCPAHRFRKANVVKETNVCKHIHKLIQTLAVCPDVERTEKGDVIVYAADAIRKLARA